MDNQKKPWWLAQGQWIIDDVVRQICLIAKGVIPDITRYDQESEFDLRNLDGYRTAYHQFYVIGEQGVRQLHHVGLKA